MNYRNQIRGCKRIVVKVGTSTLIYDNGNINLTRIEKLTRVLSDLMNSGREIVLVSSGAIGVGVNKLKLKEKPKSIKEKQAVAAVGQCELMYIYSKLFGEYSHVVGQILLTRDVVEDNHIRENVVNTFETLIKNGIIPIVNENDTVSIDEIENIVRFGDKDGFYDSDPRKNKNSKLIKTVEEITPTLEGCAGGAGSSHGTGGMATKLTAAKRAINSGCNMILANGDNPSILLDIIGGKEIGTLFIKNG